MQCNEKSIRGFCPQCLIFHVHTFKDLSRDDLGMFAVRIRFLNN